MDVFNVVQKQCSVAQIRPFKQNTVVVLVYDTDAGNCEILRLNVKFLKSQKVIKEVICIPQVNNLEDELMRACQIKNVEELTHSSTKTDYKRELISCTNLDVRLRQCKFDISKFWNEIPKNEFQEWGNDASKIKL